MPAPAQTRLRVDALALAANYRLLRALGHGAECAPAVKADAYGLSLDLAIPALRAAGAQSFFVAHASECLRLRALAPDATIFCLNAVSPSAYGALRAIGARPVLSTPQSVSAWRNSGGGPCAIQIDTGMNRLGLSLGQWRDIAATLDAPALGLSLLLSHFVEAETMDSPVTARQIADFAAARALAPEIPASLANSSGHFLKPCPAFQITRPGYALYGGNPTPDEPNPMRPVAHLTSFIQDLRELEPGETCGYNGAWRARRRSRLATIGLGYADGLPRSASGDDAGAGAMVEAGGTLCPVVGRVSMDLTIVDVTDAPKDWAALGAPIEILNARLTIEDLARAANVSGYEALTRLGARFDRALL